jgi:hypothetical protein
MSYQSTFDCASIVWTIGIGLGKLMYQPYQLPYDESMYLCKVRRLLASVHCAPRPEGGAQGSGCNDLTAGPSPV